MTELAYVPGGPPLLVGKTSRDLRSQVEKLKDNQRDWILKHFSLLFAVSLFLKNNCVFFIELITSISSSIIP